MNWLLNTYVIKTSFLNIFFNWVCINSYLNFTLNLFTFYFHTFFFNLRCFDLSKLNDTVLFNTPIKTVKLDFIKKKLFYYLFLSQTPTSVHWVFSNFISRRFLDYKTLKVDYFFFTQIKNFMNLLYNLIKRDYLFFFITFELLKFEVISFSKYVFSITTFVENSFLFDLQYADLRKNYIKYYFVEFLKDKNIKLLIFLSDKNNLFYFNFIKQVNVLTFGLITSQSHFCNFDY